MIQNEGNVLNNHLDTFKNFEKFFDLSPDLLCVAGFDGYFKRINPAVCKLLGYSAEELMSKPINEFVFYADQNNTATARNELRKKVPLFDFENRYITKNGGIVWLLWTSFPVKNEKQVYAIAKNITYKKELEEERNFHFAELTKINTDLRELNYTTLHDLRSPVNNLLSVFDLLDTSKIKDSETLEYIAILKSTSESLKQTLNEYVAILNKKNETNLHLEEQNLAECLNEVLLSINSLIQNSHTTLNVDFSQFEKVNFDKAYLKSIFLNLITNSIKYVKPNCLPTISIHSENKSGKKQLIISDNGIGFDMDKVKNKIFKLHEKFHDHTDSSGIGLYLVYNHITNLGGQITVKSKINEGTKFIITFKD